MNATKIFNTALVVLCISASSMSTVILSFGYAACDNKKASASVGACKAGVALCGGVSQSDCKLRFDANGKTLWYAVEVKNDFPTGCVNGDGYNCNTPGKPCSQPCRCRWENGECKFAAGSGVWSNAPKRTTVSCDSGG